MQKLGDETRFSASDLVNFLECEHLTALDLVDLDTPLQRTKDDDSAKLIQAKGIAHEARFVATLKARHASFLDIAASGGGNAQKIDATRHAMRQGVEIIYQAALRDGHFIGHADFLRKVARPSRLGAWSYEVLDTKLARTTKAKFIVQLGFYSALVATEQGVEPLLMHVVLGNQSEASYRVADYSRYLNLVTRRFVARVADKTVQTYPDPCERCAQCKWRELCEARRVADDHLCQVANIRRGQTIKLQAAQVTTLAALANLSSGARIPKLAADTLTRLRQQARLQLEGRLSGQGKLELLALDPDGKRGFARMPRFDAGDLFFDMEGDPFEEGGLEYLFGLYFLHNGQPDFKPFWGHNRTQEKLAFEAFMDFVTDWLRRHPQAHIYHYAHYEPTALKRLMSLHATREAEVDNLLRTARFVDLYQVVREAIRVSEPAYSLKNIEHFYRASRTGGVTDAGASIVYYERWRETGDAGLLKAIEDYNRDDVRSTFELREWLLTLRPADLPWRGGGAAATGDVAQIGELTDAEKRLVPYRIQLVDSLPADRAGRGAREHLNELTYQLLDFHRRADKPGWWAMFSRQDMAEDELHEDVECIGGLTLDAANPPYPDKRSTVYTYRFPEQETKLKTGDQATIVETRESVAGLEVNENARRVSFRVGPSKAAPPARMHLGPGKPIKNDPQRDALFRFAHSVVDASGTYPALEQLLGQAPPRVRGLAPGSPIVPTGPGALARTIDAIANLDCSYVFVQGPPGTGKTYTGARVIVALMRRGYKVGVSSNSHKAINNLLNEVEQVAHDEGFSFRGVKKSSRDNPDSLIGGDFVSDVFKNDEVVDGLARRCLLAAGTAWLFADDALDRALDFLFVDEAGQVALANLVAMGTSARNVVLLGDQMQLGQPIQGVHPGRSGESVLEYLLNGAATVEPDRGIFLETTFRMHPDVCRFISEAVYDARLEPESANATQSLLLSAGAHPALAPTGVQYLPIEHENCAQKSREEAELVKNLVDSLLNQRYRDKAGGEHPMTLEDILVVAPYNMQVNLLKQTLPGNARVGTVDKFQGQEAQVVIFSMTTSSGDDLPRNIEFLFSKNRLNVAISRAKCLALFIANPNLMSIKCSTPEQMALVNVLCWVDEYARRPMPPRDSSG